MGLIVQKFGGTSVADSTKILAAARKAIRAQHEGNQVVVVVSAMGKNTDQLIALANEINDNPPAREMDMLLSTGEQVSVALMAMAVERLGSKAISMTGTQIGIRTDSTHTKARIRSISTDTMRRALDEGKVVIAAGFQGIDEEFNITTLGRGGSDTTAVALAAVLGADACEIYTDVDGVYTTDPRILPEARLLRRVSYDEMLELASLGAGVMHSRAIEFGKKFGVPIHVRSSFTDVPGTLIVADPEAPDQPVSGAALVRNEAVVTIRGVSDQPGTSMAIFSRIARRAVAVDMIVQNLGAGGKADISFTVPRVDLRATLEAVEEAAQELGAEEITHDDSVAKVSAVGLGMAHQPGVAERMFHALSNAGINIQMITTSEIKISALISRDQADAAVRAVHRAFELDKAPAKAPNGPPPAPASGSAVDVVRRLQGMEDLAISDVSLDATQALVTIAGIPDHPGLAASVFDGIAAGGILVDMIVQSYAGGTPATLSFTVPQESLKETVAVAEKLTTRLQCGPVTSTPKIAMLSVSGIGLRSHTGVAIRMFEALAHAGINIDMINTSEVRVTVVVEGQQGEAALKALRHAFADVQQ
ncbi:MAG: aspartate kinase [Pirellulales bacterium]|nr:aspartate kinase [Pirellulales bacterium]